MEGIKLRVEPILEENVVKLNGQNFKNIIKSIDTYYAFNSSDIELARRNIRPESSEINRLRGQVF